MSHIQLGRSIPTEYALNSSPGLEQFVGFRIGDVNHDAIFNSIVPLQERSISIPWEWATTHLETAITAPNKMSVFGFQLCLINTNGWNGVSIESTIPGIEFKIINTELRINWIGTQAINLSEKQVIFTIRGTDVPRLYQGPLKSEWYDQEYHQHSIQFVQADHTAPMLLSLYPNPVQDIMTAKAIGSLSQGNWSVVDQNRQTHSSRKMA
jgi:hypothetical protein